MKGTKHEKLEEALAIGTHTGQLNVKNSIGFKRKQLLH
jgi:hypothetical protein